jgi:hypothetical protein
MIFPCILVTGHEQTLPFEPSAGIQPGYAKQSHSYNGVAADVSPQMQHLITILIPVERNVLAREK